MFSVGCRPIAKPATRIYCGTANADAVNSPPNMCKPSCLISLGRTFMALCSCCEKLRWHPPLPFPYPTPDRSLGSIQPLVERHFLKASAILSRTHGFVLQALETKRGTLNDNFNGHHLLSTLSFLAPDPDSDKTSVPVGA